jgi:hypothetical protein
MLILSLFYLHFFHNYDIDVKPMYSIHFLNFFLNFFMQMIGRLNHFWLNISHFPPQVFHIINKKYCSFSFKFSKLSIKKIPHFLSNFSCYLTKSTPTFFSLLTKSIPLFSLKFFHIIEQKNHTFFSQVFQVINKKYLTFLKCLSHYLI